MVSKTTLHLSVIKFIALCAKLEDTVSYRQLVSINIQPIFTPKCNSGEPLNRFSCRYANPYQGFQKFSKFIIAIKPGKNGFQMFLLYTLIHADAGEIIFPGLRQL